MINFQPIRIHMKQYKYLGDHFRGSRSISIDTIRLQWQSSDNSVSTSYLFAETVEITKTLYCFLTKGLINVKRVPCICTRTGVIDNKFNMIALNP